MLELQRGSVKVLDIVSAGVIARVSVGVKGRISVRVSVEAIRRDSVSN